MKISRLYILLVPALMLLNSAQAQNEKRTLATGTLFAKTVKDTLKKDSVIAPVSVATVPQVKKDSVKKHDPRIATRRSAILPGWGQAYNREYWKIPIVYGILSIPTVMFFYNNSYYKKTKFAYDAKYADRFNGDTSLLRFIDPEVKGLSLENLQNYRNSFRRDRDYSILWFLLAWGLQVADATVFAHLYNFNVSDDLSMQLKPTLSPQNMGPGLSLTLNLRNTHKARVETR